jgi:hypothetical protein
MRNTSRAVQDVPHVHVATPRPFRYATPAQSRRIASPVIVRIPQATYAVSPRQGTNVIQDTTRRQPTPYRLVKPVQPVHWKRTNTTSCTAEEIPMLQRSVTTQHRTLTGVPTMSRNMSEPKNNGKEKTTPIENVLARVARERTVQVNLLIVFNLSTNIHRGFVLLPVKPMLLPPSPKGKT